MKGTLVKTENGWMVAVVETINTIVRSQDPEMQQKAVPSKVERLMFLHPDDSYTAELMLTGQEHVPVEYEEVILRFNQDGSWEQVNNFMLGGFRVARLNLSSKGWDTIIAAAEEAGITVPSDLASFLKKQFYTPIKKPATHAD